MLKGQQVENHNCDPNDMHDLFCHFLSPLDLLCSRYWHIFDNTNSVASVESEMSAPFQHIDPMMNRNYLRMMNSFFKNVMRRMKKDEGLTIIDWAAEVGALTGAIPLPHDTGTFGCSVSRLTRFIPP